jgi:hypothetical protein
LAPLGNFISEGLIIGHQGQGLAQRPATLQAAQPKSAKIHISKTCPLTQEAL